MDGRRVVVVGVLLLGGCDTRAEGRTTAAPDPAPVAPAPAPTVAAPAVAAGELDPGRGTQIGAIFEAYLSPHQEGDEEENTPATTPKQFRSTTPSQNRAAREAAGHRAHGQVRFTNDFSRAFVDVKIEGIDLKSINMFHIHCGKPGILGPILVDFAHATDLQGNLADGMFSVEIRNEHLVQTVEHAHGLVGAFTTGCVIPSPSLGSVAPVKVSTVAGMAQLARDGELYFNLHTTGQSYFGDIRGQIHPLAPR
ncbi:CHRD domain-containing protein [Nannocystis bainbridge]|uniref:CHRD domain-containing protein n=1 Tax=Nannocystis bainbridge TaxID=2995303 RepID=A0ABT5E6B5_9BACT|nr:CHRD domain-containing protein [Nannocystis bainbridge]MDC0721406.1 CHRD domain-containing protein [Nannocystis bainbridge]